MKSNPATLHTLLLPLVWSPCCAEAFMMSLRSCCFHSGSVRASSVMLSPGRICSAPCVLTSVWVMVTLPQQIYIKALLTRLVSLFAKKLLPLLDQIYPIPAQQSSLFKQGAILTTSQSLTCNTSHSARSWSDDPTSAPAFRPHWHDWEDTTWLPFTTPSTHPQAL